MADEATLRFILEGGGGGEAPHGGAPPGPTGPAAPRPVAEPAGAPRPSQKKPVAESMWDQVFKVLDKFRGTLGGAFGKVAGSALDLASALYKMRKAADKVSEDRAASFASSEMKAAKSRAEASRAWTREVAAALAAGKEPPAPPPGTPTPQYTPAFAPAAVPAEFKPFAQNRGPTSAFPAARPGAVRAGAPPAAQPSQGIRAGAPPPATRPPEEIPTVYPAGEPVGTELAGGAIGLAGAAAIAIAALEALKAVKDGLAGAARSAGQFAGRLISADASTASSVELVGDSARAISDKLFYVSPALGILGATAGGAAQGLADLMRTLDAVVDRYAGYSPAIASAQAMAEVTQVLGDMRRAQQAAPDLVRYIQVRTELQQRFEDMKIRLLQKIAPAAIDAMQLLEKAMPLIELVVKMGAEQIRLLTQIIEISMPWARWLERPTPPAPLETLPTEDLMRGFPFELLREGQTDFSAPGNRPPAR